MTESALSVTPELTLRSVLHDLQTDAAAIGAVDLARSFAALDERLRSRRLLIAVVGEHNRGKSTLINSLIGHTWLPVGQSAPALPPVYISAGAQEQVEVIYDDGSTAGSTQAELLALSPDDAASVSYVRVSLPSPDLHGLVLVDTPGLNDPDTRRLAQTVYELLPRCDLALLVLDSAQAFGVSEHELVEQELVKAGLQKLVVVLNRDDDLEDETQRLAVRDRVLRLMTPLLGTPPEILPFAARTALRARERDDARLLARSGYPELRGLLRACAADRAHLLQHAVVGRALGFGLALQARLEEPAVGAQGAVPLNKQSAQESEVDLASQANKACRTLEGVRDDYLLELRAFTMVLRDTLPDQIAEAPAADIRRFLPFYIQDHYATFLRDHETAIQEQIQAALQKAGLEDLPAPTIASAQPAAPGLHPFVAPDFMEDSLLLTTFMQLIGLVIHPLVAGAMMTLGPALRLLTRQLHVQDERTALLQTAQASVLEGGMALERHISAAFDAATEAVRAATQPSPVVPTPPPLEDTARQAARERVTVLLQTLQDHKAGGSSAKTDVALQGQTLATVHYQ